MVFDLPFVSFKVEKNKDGTWTRRHFFQRKNNEFLRWFTEDEERKYDRAMSDPKKSRVFLHELNRLSLEEGVKHD